MTTPPDIDQLVRDLELTLRTLDDPAERAAAIRGAMEAATTAANEKLAEAERKLAEQRAAKPVAYCLMNSEGEMYWNEEECIWSSSGECDGLLEAMQEDEPDDGWHEVALYSAISPTQPTEAKNES